MKSNTLATLDLELWSLTVGSLNAEQEHLLMHLARIDARWDGVPREEVDFITHGEGRIRWLFEPHPHRGGHYTCKLVVHPWAKKETKSAHHPDADYILGELNRLTGRCYRPNTVNLRLISGRLEEPGVAKDGVLKMLNRQCALWGGDPVMCHYLRPGTLFRASKFNQYYDEKDLPIKGLNLRFPSPEDVNGPNGLAKKMILPEWMGK